MSLMFIICGALSDPLYYDYNYNNKNNVHEAKFVISGLAWYLDLLQTELMEDKN